MLLSLTSVFEIKNGLKVKALSRCVALVEEAKQAIAEKRSKVLSAGRSVSIFHRSEPVRVAKRNLFLLTEFTHFGGHL